MSSSSSARFIRCSAAAFRRTGVPQKTARRFYSTPSQPIRAPEASSSKSESPPAASTRPSSSCLPGTPLTGLEILKDRPELLARPDEEYPDWLWDLISDPSMKTTKASVEAEAGALGSGGGAAAAPAVMTKGMLRIQQKKEMRDLRAAARAAARASAAASPTNNAAASGTAPPIGSAESLQAVAQEVVTGREAEASEKERKKALSKAAREAIRAQNFLAKS